MMNKPLYMNKDDGKREPLDLDKIHRVIEWAAKRLEAFNASNSKVRSRQDVKSQRLVGNFINSYDFDLSLLDAVLDELKDCQYDWLLSHQFVFISGSILRKRINAGVRTCERERLIILGVTELLRATSKFARAPPRALVNYIICR